MHPQEKFLGVGTVGDRGQVAIPTKARQTCKIKSGDKMMFFSMPDDLGFLVLKTDSLSSLVRHLNEKVSSITDLIEKNNKKKK